MDGSKFDDFARASAISRRGALKLVAGAVASFLGASISGQAAPNDLQRAGKLCDKGQPCGSLAPCTNGYCTPIACEIGGAIYQGAELNPDNTCQFCIPTLDSWTAWLGIIGDGQPCTTVAGACTASSGQCLNAQCIADAVPDDTACGTGQVCCSGQCCNPGECCGAAGACEACFDGCEIQGIRYDAGTAHLTIDCLYCNPDINATDWTPIADDTACGGVAGRFCCNGACCSPTECCSDAGMCVDCFTGCLIDNTPVEPFTSHPSIDCLWCDPDINENDWSPVPDQSICGGVPGRVCCNGECCSPTECCNGVACEECGPHCRIENADIDAGTSNPQNVCEFCKPEQDLADWSNADNNTSCGSNNQVCCNGACCGSDQCCDDSLGCGTCFCTIGTQRVPNLNTNPDNRCQICDYHRDPDDWSTYFEAETCGNNNDRECCLGACCPQGECCVGNACATCPCEIGNSMVDPGDFNQSNACQYCDPDANRFDWSVLGDGEDCDRLQDQMCCGGICCPLGECCVEGECVTCPCEIGDDSVPAGTINDSNSCQICDPARNRFDWSPVDEDTVCGPEEGQTCCAGECCESGECCILEACGPCICVIGADTFEQDDRDSDTECRVCDARRDPFDWSAAEDEEPCLPGSELICCSGACCADGECCVDGACNECQCTIGDLDVPAGDHNPENDCEVCSPRESSDSWTVEPDGASCGPTLAQECCGGLCCPDGQCCFGGECAPCHCTIGGETVPAGDHNPANDCQVCSPRENGNGWTIEPDGAACGPTLSFECCEGTCKPSCLPPGCIIEGVFYPHGQVNPNNFCEVCDIAFPTQWGPVRDNFECPEPCLIDEEWIPGGTENPDNECECCAPHLSETEWSPCDWLMCGENEELHCCNSVCCATEDECCGDDLTCTLVGCPPEACTIDGVEYEDFAVNPANPCQYCDLGQSATAWSVAQANTPCGSFGEQFCCNGQCCPLGVCCNSGTLTCDPGRCDLCVIAGRVYDSGERNPANNCQWCNPFLSTVSWSFVTPNFFCDTPNRQGACCNGNCCATGMFCRTSDFSCQPM